MNTNETRMHCVCDRGQIPQTPPQTGGRPLPAVCRIPVITFACFQKKSCCANPTLSKVEMRRCACRPVVASRETAAVLTECSSCLTDRRQRLDWRCSPYSYWGKETLPRLQVLHHDLLVVSVQPLVFFPVSSPWFSTVQLWGSCGS